MTSRVVFHELAERELIEATEYYESARAGLGAAFLRAVERAIPGVAAHPGAGHLVSGDVRRLPLARFPYAVLYRQYGQELRVLAIAATRRRPFYWRTRR